MSGKMKKSTSCKQLRYIVYLYNPFTGKWTERARFCTLKEIAKKIGKSYKQVSNIYTSRAKRECYFIKIRRLELSIYFKNKPEKSIRRILPKKSILSR